MGFTQSRYKQTVASGTSPRGFVRSRVVCWPANGEYGKPRAAPPLPKSKPVEPPATPVKQAETLSLGREKQPSLVAFTKREERLTPGMYYCATCGGELLRTSPSEHQHIDITSCKGSVALFSQRPRDLVTLMLMKPDEAWREDFRLRLEKFCYGCRFYTTSSDVRMGTDVLFRCTKGLRGTGYADSPRPASCAEKVLEKDEVLATWWAPLFGKKDKEVRHDEGALD